MIIDATIFFNELDLLELRMRLLDPLVERFVLVESPWTFSGQRKPLVFLENQARFHRFLPKTIYVTMNALPDPSPWENEYRSRDAIGAGLEGVPDDATIMISDIDEIPDPSLVAQLPRMQLPITFEHEFYYYYLNCRVDERWQGTKAYRRSQWTTGREMRRHSPSHQVVQGGWHFSYLGGEEAIRQKIQAFSHQELNRPEYTSGANIRRALQGHDLFGRAMSFEFIPRHALPSAIAIHEDLIMRYVYAPEWADLERSGDEG